MKRIRILLAACCVLSACASTPEIERRPMADMYASAYEKIDDNNYDDAAAGFLEIESSYPASPWAADALVMAAYSQYMADNFAAAMSTIDRFMRFHPGHANVDYILYLK